jgi:hypothetical protein
MIGNSPTEEIYKDRYRKFETHIDKWVSKHSGGDETLSTSRSERARVK